MAKHIDFEEESRRRIKSLDMTGGQANGGLTVLDYFAGKVLEGMLASPKYKGSMADYVQDAYTAARLMLKERERVTQNND